MEQLEQHFTTNYQPPDITIDQPPAWLHQNNNTTDVIEDPIVPEEVYKASATYATCKICPRNQTSSAKLYGNGSTGKGHNL